MSKTDREDGTEKDGFVQSVTRALNLLELLAEDEEGYRLSDLAERAGLSPSTVHRLLTTMEQRRFVQFDQSDGMWHVGRQSFSVGSAFVRRRNFVAQTLPFLRRLRDQTRETVNLAVADEGEIVVLVQVESREIVRAITRAGGRAPMTSSGLGKSIMATYSNDDVSALIQKHGMRRVTPSSIIRAGELREELQRIRVQGYALDNEEYSIGLRCVAAVVYNEYGEALASISVSAPIARITDERLISLGPIVAEVAAEITDALGGKRPSSFGNS
ncbi:IclR family transcriptional regulator C-terminal domain-containing protein [Bradyrhizobium sp. BR13661]|jgi:IclR family acetate operon transcriptional repressor|uniref:IclR family transcriptional regulator domain-containing protein n=1 Tax=Bradyrhizobium sp. BR13661 TaxID=2940622 RepID=UPI0024752B7E|nr:IclR family transcriptional regulator C-terminal domain-containing protein [Bradyrhizobium sp. BR13661]MDH6257575.1 IclR family acetate operon transcriptional repressor [Bradyrhizobium sp. BR13661]